MPTVHYYLSLAIILHVQCYLGAADFAFPSFPPSFGNACNGKNCGKGNCVASDASTFGFECECNAGWRQARSEDDEHFKFLPCVIPNCTINNTCAKAPAPTPNNQQKANLSFFDPCSWTDCGGGFCNKTSLFTHTCECEEGYYNLFNSTTFPCYQEYKDMTYEPQFIHI